VTKKEFVAFLGEYFSKMRDNQTVLTEIGRVVSHSGPKALETIKFYLERNFSPGQYVGVKDIFAAADANNVSLSSYHDNGTDVSCEVCNRVWDYAQGVRDICPYCGFPYELTFLQIQYEKAGMSYPYMEHKKRLIAEHKKVLSRESTSA